MGRPAKKDRPAKAEELTLRRARVADLRRQGATWHAIGADTGTSHEQARQDWFAWIEALDPPADREARRTDIREQYEWLRMKYGREASNASADGDMIAADKAERRVMSALEALRKLDGLDMPASVDVTSGGQRVGMSEETAARLAEATRIANERALIPPPS